MPQSLVLNLVTQTTIPQKYLQGRALQQLFFNLLDEVDPELAHVLRQDEYNRAYSLSALQIDTQLQANGPTSYSPTSYRKVSHRQTSDSLTSYKQHVPCTQGNLRLYTQKRVPATYHDAPLQFLHHQAIAPDTRCWWRITFLDDELFDHLIFLWNQLVNEPFQLGAGTVVITHVSADAAPTSPSLSSRALAAHWPDTGWASSCSYRDLYENASAYEQDIHIQFVTPTAFEEEGYISPMPTANAVFHPLRKRWNHFSGLVFAPSLIKNIVPLKFDIETQDIQAERATGVRPRIISGCTGQVNFRIVSSNPLTIKRINALADFSRYCGIGYGTPIGMGAVRRLSEANALTYKPQIQS